MSDFERKMFEALHQESMRNMADRQAKMTLIRKAYDYNADKRAMASCNSLYMGSMATAMLMTALGGRHGRDSLDVLIANATDAQLDAGLAQCENIIRHGKLKP